MKKQKNVFENVFKAIVSPLRAPVKPGGRLGQFFADFRAFRACKARGMGYKINMHAGAFCPCEKPLKGV
ncbi:MAG: hypothetical protein PUD73_10055 [bacterium]|nr:hypothetical protein [bacterium]